MTRSLVKRLPLIGLGLIILIGLGSIRGCPTEPTIFLNERDRLIRKTLISPTEVSAPITPTLESKDWSIESRWEIRTTLTWDEYIGECRPKLSNYEVFSENHNTCTLLQHIDTETYSVELKLREESPTVVQVIFRVSTS